MRSVALSPQAREAALEAMGSTELDVLVVGGGVVGSGAALDAATERKLQGALETVMEGRTTFVIAHRLATIRDADRILVFHEGRIVEAGTFDQLVAEGGRFAERHERLRLRPDVIRSFMQRHPYQLKFVIDRPADLDEVRALLAELPDVDRERVLLMPPGVTAEEVRRVAREHLHPEALQLLVVGDPAAVRGPLEEMAFWPLVLHDAEAVVR